MGCGASSALPKPDKVTASPARDPAPKQKKSAIIVQGISLPDSLSILEKLDQLTKERPHIDKDHHQLNYFVKTCRKELRQGGDTTAAQDALDRLTMEITLEEKKLAAAFTRFDYTQDSQLAYKEVRDMMDYLGFPTDDEDVNMFFSVLDANADKAVSFSEFLCCVGRMGGSGKLFETRRQQIQRRGLFELSTHQADLLRSELQLAGIDEDCQAHWQLVTSGSELDAVAKLEPCQKAAIRHIRAIAQSNHEAALPTLQARVSKLGFEVNDLQLCFAWIRELAPIIIHLDISKIGDLMRKDTHYRNQFETKTSGGLLRRDVRITWERYLFGNAYDDALPVDRPKYGVQNVWNDHRGVMGCKQYGDAYLVLKNVRLRSTFSPMDSGGLVSKQLAVLDFYGHVLNEFTDEELLATLRVSKGGGEYLEDSMALSATWGRYKEAQIHGLIDFRRDIDRLVVPDRLREQTDWLDSIADAHGWSMTWISEMKCELQERSRGVELKPQQFAEKVVLPDCAQLK